MKEILKLWYFGVFKKTVFESSVMIVGAFFVGYILFIPMISSQKIETVVMGYFILALLLCCALIPLWFNGISPLFAIIRFKKRFFFLPPATNEGRIAMQSKVDYELHMAAVRFFVKCDEEKGHLSLLIGKDGLPVKWELSLSPNEIRATEENLDKVRRELGVLKKQFWQKHAAAKNDFLPAAFEVYPSIHNYETNPPRKTVPKKSSQSVRKSSYGKIV